jgi:hypothetical protein
MPRTSGKPILVGVQFEEAVVALQYIDPNDLKANGAQKHLTLYVPRDDDYDDEIAAIEDAVQYLIADIGEDWSQLRSVDELKRSVEEADPDDDEGEG